MPVANRILFIVADDLGYGDLHPHHAWLRKPALDALAARSRVFSQFRTLSPVCSPSRAAALTGQNPSRYCVRIQFADHDKNAKRGIPDWVTPAAPTLARYLQQAGYATAHYGKWHLSGDHEPIDRRQRLL